MVHWSLSYILWEKWDIRGFILNAVSLTLKIQGPFIPSVESNSTTFWSPLGGGDPAGHQPWVKSYSVRKTVPELEELESW